MDDEKVKALMEHQLNTFRNGVKLVCLMQATLEQMDTMKSSNLYRHNLKRLMSQLEKEIEKTVINPLSSLDASDEDMVTRIQSNMEMIMDMSIDELGGLQVALEENRG